MTDKNTVTIDDNLCIACGRCYNACPHNAIYIIDDLDEFINSVNKGEKNIVIISPAIITAFKDNYKRFINWIKESFVLTGVFDEGLGAELASLLYLNQLKSTKRKPILYQHCPTIVEYIKINFPNLIEHLAPIQSPAILLAKLIRKVFNYDGNISYIGPCLSKRREFKDTDTNNIVQFNITFDNINKYINMHNINLERYDKIDYDYLPVHEGSIFCKPKGFQKLINRFNNNISINNIEGIDIYKKYLIDLSGSIDIASNYIPDIIDILNCEGGCFRGPVSCNNLNYDEEKYLLNLIKKDAENNFKNVNKVYKLYETILKENKDINFERVYLSENSKPVITLANSNLKEIYRQLNKFESKDFLNCRSCGFNTCQEFTTSFYYKKNENFNCRYYTEVKYKNFISENTNSYKQIELKSSVIKKLLDNVNKITNRILATLITFEEQLKTINNLNNNLNINADKFEPIIMAISDVSEQINLLSLNASIEASRTGELGKGFSVVSLEIRKLADKTKLETSKISPVLQNIISDLKEINNHLVNVLTDRNNFSEIVLSLNESIGQILAEIENLFNALSGINLD